MSPQKTWKENLTEREFAGLAMFAALDPEIGVATQKVAVGDPTQAIRGGGGAEGVSAEQDQAGGDSR